MMRTLSNPISTLGNVHIKNGEVDKAVECYSNAIELDPTNATYFCNRYCIHIMYILAL